LRPTLTDQANERFPLQAIDERDGIVRETLEKTRIAARINTNTKDKFAPARRPFCRN
jgi:hypothetical protein